MKYTYFLENLNCAHCAAKIEQKIAQTNGFENVSFNFASKTLRFSSEQENPVERIQQICDSIEDGVTVVDSRSSHNVHEHEHNHGHHHSDHCDCGHDHSHVQTYGEHHHVHEHGHSHEENSKSDMICLIAAIVLGLSALGVHLFASAGWSQWLVLGLSVVSTLLAGWKVFISGIKNAFKLNINETTLITVAVIAAFFLGEYVEAAMVTILFAVGEFIEDKAVDAARKDIEKISQIRPDTATLFENGTEREVDADEVEVGSTIIVKPHERIPIDGKIVSGASTVNNAALTGESVPVNIAEGDEVMSGAINGDHAITLETTKEFGESTATRILELVEDAAAQKGKSERFISRFAAVYTPVIIAISVLIAALPPLLGLGEFTDWLYRALVVLVASCPCAIVISVPLSYYSGIGTASKNGVLIKGGRFLETLAKSDTFVFDKTGTLTNGKLSVGKVIGYNGYSKEDVIGLAAACEKYSTHPAALAIKSAAKDSLPELSDYTETAGRGTSALYNGKAIACGNARLLIGEVPKELKDGSFVFLVYDNELIGAIELSDTVNNSTPTALSALKGLGIKKLVMLTGDSQSNADRIAKSLPLDSYSAALLPEQKLTEVSKLNEDSKAVCFVGDGINDAPVLSACDCGIAMGLGSEAAIEVSDVVLSSGTLENLPVAIKIARKTMNTIRANIIFALAIKALVIILACFGLAAMWMSVIADTGVSVLCVLYSLRIFKINTNTKLK